MLIYTSLPSPKYGVTLRLRGPYRRERKANASNSHVKHTSSHYNCYSVCPVRQLCVNIKHETTSMIIPMQHPLKFKYFKLLYAFSLLF
jgi:hypothetical protein